jgi:hypothetical protein
MKRIMVWAITGLTFFTGTASLLFAEEKIELFPSAPYDRFIIYQNLAIFWVAILGLVVLLRIKLREVERIQGLGVDKEEEKVPILE